MKLTFEAINSSTHKLFINWASFCNLWRQPPAGHYKEYSLRHTASHLLHFLDLEATSMFFYTEHSLHATIPLTMPVKDSAHLTQFNKVSQKCQDLQAPSAAVNKHAGFPTHSDLRCSTPATLIQSIKI